MYGQRMTRLFLYLFLMALALVGCTATSEPETAVSPTVVSESIAETSESLTPEQVTADFYNWYLETIGDRSDGSFTNPLVEGLYRDSEYLSADFVAYIDETIAGFQGGGFDPILLAQDIPVRFAVQEAVMNGAMTTVDVHFYWGGNPGPSVRTVHLIQQNGRWLIDNVTAEMPAAAMLAAPHTPEDVVVAFYDWYLDYIGDLSSDDFRNPLVDKAYHDAPYLTASFVGHIDELLASFTGGGYDPFLCAQAVPTEMTPDVTCARSDMASVVMRSSFANHLLTVDLRPEGESWVITNITCAHDPASIATTFYTWYLGYIGNCGLEEMRNPLADKAYQGHPLLAESFVQEVDKLLAGFDQGGYDPFLLAQDVPQDFSVDPSVEADTAVVHLQFGPDSVKHLRVTVNERGKISAITENELLPSSGPENETGSSVPLGVFISDEYGFSFGYPVDWVLQTEAVGGPGMPDDWPVQVAWYMMPQDVADALASRSGPPDPNAPIIVAPFQVEVVVGDEQAMARVYYDFAVGEQASINNHQAIILRHDPGYSHVIFPHPLRPDTWIIFTDWVTEFPGREAQAQVAEPAWLPVLSSLQFNK
ncbi:MAG: DUF3828 domain-containing protein [Anaerolineae bacterium]|nr:DUF3828 domain-containing protein [Anaerolineae bacterium]